MGETVGLIVFGAIGFLVLRWFLFSDIEGRLDAIESELRRIRQSLEGR